MQNFFFYQRLSLRENRLIYKRFNIDRINHPTAPEAEKTENVDLTQRSADVIKNIEKRLPKKTVNVLAEPSNTETGADAPEKAVDKKDAKAAQQVENEINKQPAVHSLAEELKKEGVDLKNKTPRQMAEQFVLLFMKKMNELFDKLFSFLSEMKNGIGSLTGTHPKKAEKTEESAAVQQPVVSTLEEARASEEGNIQKVRTQLQQDGKPVGRPEQVLYKGDDGFTEAQQEFDKKTGESLDTNTAQIIMKFAVEDTNSDKNYLYVAMNTTGDIEKIQA